MKKFILSIQVLILCSLLYSCSSGPKDTLEPSGIINDVNYTVLNKVVDEDVNKAKLLVDIIIDTADLDEIKLRGFLSIVYEKLYNEDNFKQYSAPEVVGIDVYTSKEKATSGMAQWIGMISKNRDDIEPDFSVSEIQLNALTEKREDKWGLTYEQRKEIWNKLIHAEDKAQREADKEYPPDKPGVTMKHFSNNLDLMGKLLKKYEKELAKEHHVPIAIIDSVSLEAFEYGWAFPK